MDALPTLPPPDEEPARLLALSGTVTHQHHIDTVTSLVTALDPDVVVATEPGANAVRPILEPRIDESLFEVDSGMVPETAMSDDSGVVVVATPGGGDELALDTVDEQLMNRGSNGSESRPSEMGEHFCIIGSEVSLSVDPYERTTMLEGVATYRQRVPNEWWGRGTTHLSTRLRAGYETEWADDKSASDPVRFVGIGDTEADLGVGTERTSSTAALVEIYSNGALDISEVDPTKFGLRSVTNVGRKRAKALRNAGITTRDGLMEVPLGQLAELPGMGRTSAAAIQTAAEAAATKTVLPTGDDALPNGDPVFIDIETDGLNPSAAWLIGVLDGGPDDGTYMAFRESHPGDGSHLDAFMTWLTGAAAGRPVVAWNGYRFDFPVIEDQLRQHCPEHVDAWRNRYCFDGYWWAVEKNGGNAALPGRTNELESVAEALGWEPSSNGIDGATVAEVYVAYRRHVEQADDPASAPEPDWARLEQYCEDDVRALATIYDGLIEAARREPATTGRTGDDSTQGSLADFG